MTDGASSRSTPFSAGSSGTGVAAAAFGILLWAAGIIMVRPIPMSGVQIAFWRVLLGAIVYWIALRISGRRLTLRHLQVTAPAAIAISSRSLCSS